MKRIELIYDDISRRHRHFRVRGRHQDGSVTVLGEIKFIKIRHLRQSAWEATGLDGSHRAVHAEKWQAALALAWDGTGYPFPIIRPSWLPV